MTIRQLQNRQRITTTKPTPIHTHNANKISPTYNRVFTSYIKTNQIILNKSYIQDIFTHQLLNVVRNIIFIQQIYILERYRVESNVEDVRCNHSRTQRDRTEPANYLYFSKAVASTSSSTSKDAFATAAAFQYGISQCVALSNLKLFQSVQSIFFNSHCIYISVFVGSD